MRTYEILYLLKARVPPYLWATSNHFVYAIVADFISISAWHFLKLAHRLCVMSLKRSSIIVDHLKKVWFKQIALLRGSHWVESIFQDNIQVLLPTKLSLL